MTSHVVGSWCRVLVVHFHSLPVVLILADQLSYMVGSVLRDLWLLNNLAQGQGQK